MSGTASIGILTGSLRAASHSRAVARCLPALAPAGWAMTELPSAGSLPHYDQDLLDRGPPEQVAEMGRRIAALDGLVLVTPEYNWSIPGVLKNALDWMSRLKPMPLRDLPAMIVTCSPGLLGGARAHAPIRNVLHALDCRILARPEIQIAQVAGKVDAREGRFTDPATETFLRERLRAFAAFVGAGDGSNSNFRN